MWNNSKTNFKNYNFRKLKKQIYAKIMIIYLLLVDTSHCSNNLASIVRQPYSIFILSEAH